MDKGKLLLAGLLIVGGMPCILAEGRPAAEGAAEPRVGKRYGYGGLRIGYLEVDHVDAGSLNLGFVLGYAFSRTISIEGSLDYHTPEWDLVDRKTYALQMSLCVYPFPSLARLRPYGVAGIGYYRSAFEIDDESDEFDAVDSDTIRDEGFHAGFGVDFRVHGGQRPGEGPRVRLDVRHLFTEEDERAEAESDGVLATIGVVFSE